MRADCYWCGMGMKMKHMNTKDRTCVYPVSSVNIRMHGLDMNMFYNFFIVRYYKNNLRMAV